VSPPLRVRDERPRSDGVANKCNDPAASWLRPAEDSIGYKKNITFWVGNCAVRYTKRTARMSALGQKQTSRHLQPMSALPPKADIGTQPRDVRFVPKADIGSRMARGTSQSASVSVI
jgi:hypothetical protein